MTDAADTSNEAILAEIVWLEHLGGRPGAVDLLRALLAERDTLAAQLAEARNSALDEAAERTLPDDQSCKCDICVALVHRSSSIRALKSEPAPRPGDMSSQGMPITFTYTNWRGETAQRTAVPKRICFGYTDWHPEPGWLMTAHELEKAADRDFALADCTFYTPRAVSVQEAAKVLLDACPNPIFDNLKPVLIGEFHQTYPFIDENGEEVTARVNVSWSVTKDIIRAALRALAQKEKGDE